MEKLSLRRAHHTQRKSINVVHQNASLKFLRKMKDSRGPGGVSHGAGSQNLSLEWPSVWGGKSLKFLRKVKESGGPGG